MWKLCVYSVSILVGEVVFGIIGNGVVVSVLVIGVGVFGVIRKFVLVLIDCCICFMVNIVFVFIIMFGSLCLSIVSVFIVIGVCSVSLIVGRLFFSSVVLIVCVWFRVCMVMMGRMLVVWRRDLVCFWCLVMFMKMFFC